jgi:hypothetical protein
MKLLFILFTAAAAMASVSLTIFTPRVSAVAHVLPASIRRSTSIRVKVTVSRVSKERLHANRSVSAKHVSTTYVPG